MEKQTEIQQTFELLQQLANIIKQEQQETSKHVNLLVKEVEKFKQLLKETDSYCFRAKMYFDYLLCLVFLSRSRKYNIAWLHKETSIKKATAYKRSKALKKKIEKSGLSDEQYMLELQSDVKSLLAKQNKTEKFETHPSVLQFINEQAEQLEKEEKLLSNSNSTSQVEVSSQQSQ